VQTIAHRKNVSFYER